MARSANNKKNRARHITYVLPGNRPRLVLHKSAQIINKYFKTIDTPAARR
jgi:hypothetical protein